MCDGEVALGQLSPSSSLGCLAVNPIITICKHPRASRRDVVGCWIRLDTRSQGLGERMRGFILGIILTLVVLFGGAYYYATRGYFDTRAVPNRPSTFEHQT